MDVLQRERDSVSISRMTKLNIIILPQIRCFGFSIYSFMVSGSNLFFKGTTYIKIHAVALGDLWRGELGNQRSEEEQDEHGLQEKTKVNHQINGTFFLKEKIEEDSFSEF